MTITEQVKKRIEEMPLGEPFSPTIFLWFGSRAAIDQALSRLARQGQIARVTRGLYVRPKENRWVGRVPPAPEAIARALAEAAGAKVAVHGAEAARHFGLTTQVPTQPVFMTTGPSRRFKLGNLECSLKHTSARKLALAGRPAGLALSALWYLGKGQVTPEVVKRIQSLLDPAEFEALQRAPLPGWMSEAVRNALRQPDRTAGPRNKLHESDRD